MRVLKICSCKVPRRNLRKKPQLRRYLPTLNLVHLPSLSKDGEDETESELELGCEERETCINRDDEPETVRGGPSSWDGS